MNLFLKISISVLIFFLIKSNYIISAQNLIESSETMIFLNQDAFMKINGNLKTTGSNTINNNGLIELNGDILSPMTDTSNNFYGKILFTGNQAQTITGSEGLKFKDITVEKTNARLFLETDILIEENIFLSEGVFDIGENNIFLGEVAQISIEDDSKYITGTTGFIEKTQILNMPTMSNPGNIGIEITTPSNLGNTIIRRFHEPTNAGGSPTIKRMFEVVPENSLTLSATITYYYIDNEDERGGIPKEAINAFIFNSSNWNILPTIQDTANNALTITQLSSFSLLTGSLGPFLPVEFLEFKVSNINNEIARLNWTTATEINNDFFTIQRSSDGLNFEDLGVIEGAGNSNNIIQYEFDDTEPLMGIAYYRIKQTDFDGNMDYSSIESIVFNKMNEIILYPNPSNLGYINIEGVELNTYISVVNELGQEVFFEQKTTDKRIPFKLETTNLSNGLYHLNLKTKLDKIDYFKFLIY